MLLVMDSESRLLIKRNEQLFKRLDINVLKPHLENSRIFTSSMLKDIFDPHTNCDLFSELPSRGPHAFSRFLEVLEKAGYETEANHLNNGNCPEYVESGVRSVFYPMESQPLGYCLIINNINFFMNGKEVIEKKREGSRIDAQRLRDFFEKVGYYVEEQTNLKCEEMKNNMENLAKSDVLKIVNCCFIIILSHGYLNDVVQDINFCELRKQKVYEIFNNINCTNLKEKPKIILFQACRGENEDDGVFPDENFDSLHFSTESTDAMPGVNVPSIINNYEKTKAPVLSDMIVIHSSLPDYACYLDEFNGSWLIQDLLSIFMENYLVQDLGSMLTTVSRKIQSRLSETDRKKQALHVEGFGVKALFHICNNNEYKGPDKNLISYLS